MQTRMRKRSARAALFICTVATLAQPTTAHAAQGAIDYVEPDGDAIHMLFSVPGQGDAAPDLDSVRVTIEGADVDATAQLAADSEQKVRRTSVLAVDVSQSMAGEKFEEAKAAARTYLEATPADVYVGIVTFAGSVSVIQEPTLNRAASIEALADLTLSRQTLLYDGVTEAVELAGDTGQRSVLVLSDGADTSGTALDRVVGDVAAAAVKVDVVALAQSKNNEQKLQAIADAGSGSVLPADDPAALSNVFAQEAAALARQVLITASTPGDLEASEGTVSVSLNLGEDIYTDSAYALLKGDDTEESETAVERPAVPVTISLPMMLGGLAAAGFGILVLLLIALGVIGSGRRQTVEERIQAYGPNASAGARSAAPPPHSYTGGSLKGSATAIAGKALSSNKGMETALGSRLDAAGLSIKPAEWVLIHAGIVVGAAFVGVVLGSFSFAVVLGAVGAVIPLLYLARKKRRRIKAFNAQLADTLQLMAGSLSAGLSFAQSADTVVREGSEPMTSEYRRALVETRLGVPIEDALEGVGDRMQSADFKWVVLAVRIQREVGGNLAEVLTQVASTIRERDYLRRQVKSLSAEGVLSAWILGALPPVMFMYFFVVRREYMQPMFDEPLGWAMLGGGAVMMAIGAFWMSRLVKLEV